MALTAKQAAFVDEYLIDLNATQAALRAGYSEKTAKQTGCENLTKPDVAEAIAKRQAERLSRLELTQDQVLRDINAVKQDAMQTVADKDGNTVMADRNAALKALELQGRHLAMFTDKQKIGGDGEAPLNLVVKFGAN